MRVARIGYGLPALIMIICAVFATSAPAAGEVAQANSDDPAAVESSDGLGAPQAALPDHAGNVDDGTVAAGGPVLDPGCSLIGNVVNRFPGNNVLVGDAFRMTEPANLFQFGFVMDDITAVPVTVDLYFSIYVRPSFTTDAFSKIFSSTATRMTGDDLVIMAMDPISEPISLAPGMEYVFSVAWNSPTLIYGNDPAQDGTSGQAFPEFPFGDYLGVSVFINPGFPTPDELALFVGQSEGPFGIELCLTGACCYDANGNGTPDACTDLSVSDCDDLPVWSAATPGTTCEGIIAEGLGCPLVTAPCCTGLQCALENKFDCEDDGGEWLPGEIDCSDPDLCTPKGACCTLSGSCIDEVTASACETIGGNYRGDDSLCDSVIPSCNVGACCLGTENCDQRRLGTDEATECVPTAGHIWNGYGSSCGEIPCQITGACCTGDSCSDTTAEDCATQGGNYRGDNTLCEALAVDCGNGACCRDGIGCTDSDGTGIPESLCDSLGGDFSGDGTTCQTIDPCPGICCEPGNFCSILDAVNCSLIGTFAGTLFEECVPEVDVNACEQLSGLLEGACCLPNATCIQAYVITCLDLGGSPIPNTDCDAPSVECTIDPLPGGCCLPDGSCDLLDAESCDSANGIFRGIGVECPDESDPLDTACDRGKCCLVSGGALEIEVNGLPTDCLIESVCDASGGLFTPDCATAVCPEGGACCLPSDTCEQLTEDRCLEAGGFFQGLNVSCIDVITCARGACCDAGACSEVLEVDCAEIFLGDSTVCGVDACLVGACCLTDGSCMDIENAICESQGGTFAGAGSQCTGGSCLNGACCHADATCDDGLFQFECDAPLDSIFPGFACDDAQVIEACLPRGLCCVNGTCLDDVESDMCLNVFNGFAGPSGSLCDELGGDATCDVGACCLSDGTCTDEDSPGDSLTRVGCLLLDGGFVVDVACEDANCPDIGACCLDGACVPDLLEADCLGQGGSFVGEGTACQTSTCDTGACCALDGTCQDDAFGFECVAIEGDFTANFPCSLVDCDPRGACCNGSSCSVLTDSLCGIVGGDYAGDGFACSAVDCNAGGCCLGTDCEILANDALCIQAAGEPTNTATCEFVTCLSLDSSIPPSGSVDARQPTEPDGTGSFGWTSVDLVFTADASSLTDTDFTVTSTAGTPPTIVSVSAVDVVLTLTFDVPIPVGAWTQITFQGDGSSVCLGSLPADADGSATSDSADITAMIDHLDGTTARPLYSVDADQNGVDEPDDLLRLIDLLNGGDMFDPWFDASTGASPCDGG